MIMVYHAEEDGVDLRLAKRFLEKLNPEIQHRGFSNPEDLATALQSNDTCDCIVCGERFRNGSGLDLLRDLRSRKITLPFIMLTDRCEEEVVLSAFEAGADDFFHKGERETLWPRLASSIKRQVEVHALRKQLKRQNRELREKETHLSLLVEESPNVVCFKDGEGRWLELNRVGREFFKLEKAEFKGKTGLELAEDHPEMDGVFRITHYNDLDVWKAGKAYRGVQTFNLPDGGTRYYRVIKIPFFNPDGSRKGILLIANNITDLKESELALAESEEFYRSLFNKAPVGVFVHDNQGRILQVNPAQAEFIKIPVDKIIGSNVVDFVPEEVKDEGIKQLQELLDDGFLHYRGYLYNSEGEKKHYELHDSRITLPGKEEDIYLAILHDITDEVEAKEQARITHDLMARLNRASTLEEMAEACVNAALEVSQTEVGGMFLRNRDSNRITLINHAGCSEDMVKALQHFDIQRVKNLGKVYRGEAHFGAFSSSETAKLNLFQGEDLKAFGAVPISQDEEVVGHLFVFSRQYESFSESVQLGLSSIALQMGNVFTALKSRIALKESQSRLELAIAAAGFNVWDWNLESGEVLYRRHSFSVTDLSEAIEFKTDTKALERVTHPDDLPVLKDKLEAHLRGELPSYKAQYRLRDRKGAWRWMTALGQVVEYNRDGTPKRLIGMDRDIDAEKSREQQLQSLRDRLELTVEATGTAIWDWNIQTGEAHYNENWANMMGRRLEDLEPTSADTWNRFCHPDDLRHNDAVLEDYFTGKRDDFECELRFKHADGSWIWIHTTGKIVEWDSAGEPLWMVGVSHDITHIKQAELELRQAREEMQSRAAELMDLNKQLEAFTYTVSHDLHAPLRHVKGFANLLKLSVGNKAEDDSLELVENINAAVGRLENMIDATLRFHRTAGQRLEYSEFSLSEKAQTILQELQDDDSDRVVETSVTPGVVVAADELLITVVLQNVLGNAWKYTARTEKAEIHVRCHEDNDMLICAVQDNGVGFEQNQADSIFLPFKRLHSSTDYPGTGIGLATAYRIITRHGGKMWAESRPGSGTTIYFSLPVRAKEAKSDDISE